MLNHSPANRGFQPAEMEAGKVWFDTFPLLFVDVVLR
jgi:hypothetical protein